MSKFLDLAGKLAGGAGSLLGGLKVYIIVGLASAAIAAAGGFSLAWQLQGGNIAKLEAKAAKDEAAAVRQALAHERAQQKASNDAGAKHEVAKEKIRLVYRTIKEKAPRYVPPEADARCVVPVGAVRLFNAGAQGVDPDEVLVPAGQPDDAASGVALSDLVNVANENAGTYHEVAQRLTDLQNLVRAQQALDRPSP